MTTRRSLELTTEQWAALDKIAAETDSTAQRGPNTGAPSWRVFVARIADSQLGIIDPTRAYTTDQMPRPIWASDY